MEHPQAVAAFRSFVLAVEPKLRRALTASYGYERGSEATCEALAYAWENWERVSQLESPVGYLYRVGQSHTRPRRSRRLFEAGRRDEVTVEPGLRRAIAGLSGRQREVVLLVCGDDWTCAEVASLLGVNASTVQRHLDRGMEKLRASLGGGDRVARRGNTLRPVEPTS